MPLGRERRQQTRVDTESTLFGSAYRVTSKGMKLTVSIVNVGDHWDGGRLWFRPVSASWAWQPYKVSMIGWMREDDLVGSVVCHCRRREECVN